MSKTKLADRKEPRSLALTPKQSKVAELLGLNAAMYKLTDRELDRFEQLRLADTPDDLKAILKDVPADNQKLMKEMLADARKLVLAGKVKQALALTSKAAIEGRRAANGYAQSLNLQEVELEVEAIKGLARNYQRVLTSADNGLATILNQAATHPKAGAIDDPIEVTNHLNAFVPIETQMRTVLAQSLSDATAVAKALDSSKVVSRLDEVEKKLNVLADLRSVNVSNLRADLVIATQNLQRNGKLLASFDLNAEFERKAHNFEVAVKQVKDVQKRENRDKYGDVLAVLPSRPARFRKGQKMAPVAQAEANFGKMLAELKSLGKEASDIDKLGLLVDLDLVQQQRDRRFKRAKLKMNAEWRRDQLLLDHPDEDVLGP
jgi:hypothetical protein